MALHGFEDFNPGNGNVASFGGQQGGAFQLPQLGQFNAIPSNFGQGGAFEGGSAYEALNLPDFNIDPLKDATTPDGQSLQQILFGGKNADGSSQVGALTGGLGAIAGIGNAYLGYKQYGLAKKELAFQQNQARINNQNQMTTLNNQMRGGAERERVASGGTSLTGDQYIAQHGIKL
jgi:hypothetical protein